MLNLLPMAPSCILLARASSKADCVTDASAHTVSYKTPRNSLRVRGENIPSKSLKLLPMLGVPSLPSREYPLPFELGLFPDNSAARRGDRGPPPPAAGRRSLVAELREMSAGELVDESDVSEWWILSLPFGVRRAFRGSPRSVEPMSCAEEALEAGCGLYCRNAGSASSSSSSSRLMPPSRCCWKRGGRRMMRDCAGLDSSSEEAGELDSSGGEAGSGLRGVLWIGREERRRRCCCWPSLDGREVVDGLVVAPGRAVDVPSPPRLRVMVPAEPLRERFGRREVVIGVAGVLASFRGRGESRRMERADIVRWWECGSAPGTGEGAAEPLAAAVALRTWARSWAVCRSVR